MSFRKALESIEPRDIKEVLYSLLDEITAEDVLQFDKEFHSAKDKQSLLAEFEVTESNQSAKRNPEILERWTHYCWIRLELSYLANQKAALNKIASIHAASIELNRNSKPISSPLTAEEVQSAYKQDMSNKKDR